MIWTWKRVAFGIGQRKNESIASIQMDGALQLFQEAISHSIGG